MKDHVVARKYALALFQLAQDKKQVDVVENELLVVKEVFSLEKGLQTFLTSPKIGKDKKREIIKNAFVNFSQMTLNTLYLLIDRHRVKYIIPTIDSFIDISYENKGIAKARVESVRALTEEESKVLASTFAKKLNKKTLQIENVVNDDLLGGIKIQIGNRIFDGSLRGKLDNLKRELIG
jgi:F-type H+-transporting ATPase subunit delta